MPATLPHIYDRNRTYNEQEFEDYICPVCGYEASVAMEYDRESRLFFPVNRKDARCPVDGIEMDKKGRG